MIFTNLAPNTRLTDALLAMGRMAMFWKLKRGAANQKLRTTMEALLPGHHLITFESGRTALHAILTAAGIRSGDEVLLQAYTCVAVPEPVLWVGATPIYVDCDETLTMSITDLEQKITDRTKAIIIQHTFGMSAHLEAILAIAKSHNLFVIEDCAHALGATYNNQILGTFADASFFSFGRDKVISSVFGGAAATKHEKLFEALSKLESEYPMPSALWILQQLLHPPIMWLGKTTYRVGGVALIWLAKNLRITSRAVYPEEREGIRPAFALHKMPNALASLALHQLKKLDTFNAHRKKISNIYTEGLVGLNISHQQITNSSDSLWLRYTLWGGKTAAIQEAAKKEGILLGDWYDTVIAPQGVNYKKINYQEGGCPNAERIAKTTINLPTDIHISHRDAVRIINIVRRVIQDQNITMTT